jgi:GH15 family glucan-1,4-alpha-glucosidase
MNYQPIENYGIVGDLDTVALVGMNGSIDFMCFPHFDSPSIFAAILDHEKGGRFRIAPVLEDVRHKQLYLPDSNILLTRFLSEEGVAEISDFMAIEEGGDHLHDLVRRVKTVRGELRFRMVCDPRFDYGRRGHRIEIRKGEAVFLPEGKGLQALRLRSDVPLRKEKGAATAEFILRAGETAFFILEEARAGKESHSVGEDYVSHAFKETLNFWRQWVARSTYRGRWRETVNRSALTLKMLTSRSDGSIVAAPTFGLPEEIGGERNWDYRYTWIRDASFTLYALIRLGYTEEAAAFMRWIGARAGELNPDGSLQIMYGIDGRHDLTEEILPHFEGISEILAGSDRERRLQPAPARHLRRAHGLGLPVRQIRRADQLRPLVESRAIDRLGMQELAEKGRGNLGDPFRAKRVSVFPSHVLGGDRPGITACPETVDARPVRPVVQGQGHDLPGHLQELLGSQPESFRPVQGFHGA